VTAKKFRGNGDKRDGKTFVALPNVVLESPGYRQASHTARSLLIDIATQYSGHNNGKLVACVKYLKPMGWKGNGTVLRALRELQDCGLLIETRKGARPNKAAWFALPWLDLDQVHDLTINPKLYQRGAYLRPDKTQSANGTTRTRKASEALMAGAEAKRTAKKNAGLTPSNGVARAVIAPSDGVRTSIHAPSNGAIRCALGSLPTPLDSAYLETPSPQGPPGGIGLGAMH